MKIFLKIIAGILVVIIIIAIALNIYFTDERLKNIAMPYLNEAVGRPVQVQSMSLTFFSTFPNPGLSIEKMSLPDDTDGDTLMALDELVVGVKLFSLLGDEINISEIKLNKPSFTYKVYKDGTSNIDFLLNKPTEKDTTSGYAINIPYFEINNAQFGYSNQLSNTDILLEDFDANISLHYADLIESTIDIDLGGLSASTDSTSYVNQLPLSLSEKSTVDLDNQSVSLQAGTFSIRGLALNLSGSVTDWSDTLAIDLNFNSSSDNFGDLLHLVPAKYEQYTEGLETRGTLALKGSVKGPVSSDQLPSFNVNINVTDGYVKNPDLPQPIEDIQLAGKASNDLITVSKLDAQAGPNNLTASGNLEHPLEDTGQFTLDLKSNINLSTISKFYDLSQFDIEGLGGKFNIEANAQGNRSKPEDAVFNATVKLADGILQYKNVPEAIDHINIDAKANQEVVTINSMSLEAAKNTFSIKGTIHNPLEKNTRTIDLNTDLRFDLATIKDFYPISEDTLKMSGLLTAQATLKGKAEEIEKSVETGSIDLKNGLIDYQKLGKPFRDISIESVLEGNKLTIVNAGFKTGENNLKASGLITDYLSDSRSINLKLNGSAKLDEIANYYDLKPVINKLTGDANLNLTARGPVNDPASMSFDGNLTISGVNMEGDSLLQPVHDLNGELVLSPSSARLKSLAFTLGSSDINLSGSLTHYMEYLKSEDRRKQIPHLSGTYKSQYLNLDELIDWQDTAATTPTPINLPDLTSSVSASIGKMVITGVTMQNLEAKASTTPTQIKLDKAQVELFEGKASGSFVWDVPQPDHTKITFQGSLDSLRAESFFKEYPILGKKNEFYKYITGAFSADVNYASELDVYLTPLLQTTNASGNFGMTKARLQGSPLQDKLADLLKAKEFRNIALDEWKSTFGIDNNILTFKNLKLTSGDIGMEMNGTQHLDTEAIDYHMKVYLPGRFKNAIASVITQQATDALTQKNGTIMAPIRVTGTTGNPKPVPDQEVIKPIIKNYLKDKAGKVLKGLFGN